MNWRVKATYDDDSTENFPQGDWYKTWSSCYCDGSYGGVHADGDGCNVPVGIEVRTKGSFRTRLMLAVAADRRCRGGRPQTLS